MKKRNLILGSAIAAALAGMSGAANAVSNLTPQGGSRPFALEPASTSTRWTMPVVRRQLDGAVTVSEDFYLKFQITNGQFASGSVLTLGIQSGPSCTSANPGSTGVIVGGGAVGDDYVTFRVNGATAPLSAGGACFDLSGSVLTTPSIGSPIQIATLNGTNFGGGNANPTSPKELDPAAASNWADFANAVSITMAPTDADCDTTDPIDLVPTPQTNSRKVFGPDALLDGECGNDSYDSVMDEQFSPYNLSGSTGTLGIARGVIVDIDSSRLEPDGSTSFEADTDGVDSFAISVDDVGELPKPAITALCYDQDKDNICDANESFNLNPVAPANPSVVFPTGTAYKRNNGFILTVNGTDIITPTTMHFDFALTVAGQGTAASRPGFTGGVVPYTVASNEWTLKYANGTLLRSSWFLSPNPANGQISTVRISNAGALDANVITCQYFLDSGAKGDCGGVLPTIASQSSWQTQVNTTLVPPLGTGQAGRGYFEFVLDSKWDVTEGLTINYNQTTNDRNTTMMRNLTELDDLKNIDVISEVIFPHPY
ncbi:MAG: hypothetical protein ACU837_02950 [Gammaproteobacteria bacterium]